ncbi:MAG TPA: hypothetical protein VIJ75_12715 [Hanamia sp.]
MNILYIKHENIDKIKWDLCVKNAANGLIYAHSFFLDAMNVNWDALVLNDYETIMPLVWKKKYGIKYVYQPFFIGSLGIFGNVTDQTVNQLLKAIPVQFKYVDIDFKENLINPEKINLENSQLKKRTNFLLDLNKKYDAIQNQYKRLAGRMIKKALENKIEIIRNCTPVDVIDFYKRNYETEHKDITSLDYNKILGATNVAFETGNAATYLAKKNEETVASYMVLKDEKFVYSLIGGSNRQGKNLGAFYLLTDAAIKDHADCSSIFRFEGSDKNGISFFNSQFNPAQVEYYHLKLNRLPWPLRLLK